MKYQNKFKGIIPPVSTIVDDKGNFDSAGMARQLDKLIAAGVNGVLILGSCGEFCHMDHAMRLAVAEFSVQHVAGRVPVLIGIAAPGTRETIAYGQHAAAIGADAVLAVNPFYTTISNEALYQHYRKIAETLTLPVFLYNFPALTGQDIGPDIIMRLAREVPNIVGIKDTVDNISHIREIINRVRPIRPDFMIFAGYDEYILDTLLLGGNGGIPATANFAPQVTCGIYRAFQDQDLATLARLQRQLASLSSLYTVDTPFYAVIKEAIVLTGTDISTAVLPPAMPLDNNKKQRVADILKRSGIALS